MESDDPPRKNYGFKEREFKRDNAPVTGLPPAPTAKDLAMLAGVKAPPARPPDRPAKAGDPNDVYAILQQNRTVEKRAGLNEVEIKKVKSRRKRDFWSLVAGGNLLIVGLVVFTGFNVVSVIFGLAGIIVISLGLTWIMWFVMDDY